MKSLMFFVLFVGAGPVWASEIAGKLPNKGFSVEAFWEFEFNRSELETASSTTTDLEITDVSLNSFLEYAATPNVSVIGDFTYTDRLVKNMNTLTTSKSTGLTELGIGGYFESTYQANKFYLVEVLLQPKLAQQKAGRISQDRTRVHIGFYHEWILPRYNWGLGVKISPSVDAAEAANGDELTGADPVSLLYYYERYVSDTMALGGTAEYITTTDNKNEDTGASEEIADRVELGIYYLQALSKNWELISHLKYNIGLNDKVNSSDVKTDDGKVVTLGLRYLYQ